MELAWDENDVFLHEISERRVGIKLEMLENECCVRLALPNKVHSATLAVLFEIVRQPFDPL